jgi:pyruvate/2-oxoglutarate dehydrogenase complex dihydrolipoamide acyltransferase (E2) component
MANRQSAPAGIHADARENTARVVMQRSALPGWFWGVLGCLSVLGVGFGILIVVARNGLLGGGAVGPAPAAAAAPTAPTHAATAPAGSPPRPQIEQLVRPSAPRLTPVAAPKPKPQAHAIKLARSPSGGHPITADRPADDTPGADKPSVDEPGAAKPAANSDEAAAAKKPTDKASGDDDQVVRQRKTGASDDDDN